MRLRWGLVAALIGCGTGNDTASTGTGVSTKTGAGSTTGSPTGPTVGSPTGTSSTGWSPSRYRVAYGWFGVQDDQVGPIDDVDLFGTPVEWPIQIAVRLADDSIDSGLTPDNHCDIVFTSTNTLGPATWTAEAGAWFAVEMPADAAVSTTRCTSMGLAPQWSDPETRLRAHRWGLALRPLTQDDIDARGGYGSTGTDSQIGKLIGASWWTDASTGTVGGGVLEPPGVALANALDGDGVLARDANHDKLPLDNGAVESPTGVVDGFYEVSGFSPWRDVTEL